MIWRFCERFGILPPGIEAVYNANADWQKAEMLSYEGIREVECQTLDSQ